MIKLPYYNCITGITEIRLPPHDSDMLAKQYIPQDWHCQSEYMRLRADGLNISDAFYEACKFAVKHHGFTGDKDSPHRE